MRNRKRTLTIVRQVLVVLTFFSGMILNFIMIWPLAEREEIGRMSGELNVYCSDFLRVIRNSRFDGNLDSLYCALSDVDPYSGHFCIIDGQDSLLFDSEHLGRKYLWSIDSLYGAKAVSVIEADRRNANNDGAIDYERRTKKIYFARFDPGLDITFFYAVYYYTAGGQILHTFFHLLLIMMGGGLLIIIISFINMRKTFREEMEEALATKSLETASAIQKAMLPRESVRLLHLDIDARLKSAQQVGGDMYYYFLRDGRLYICIGDVSGKGIPASLCMSRGVTLFRNMAQAGRSAADIACRMNDELCRNNEQNIFLTAFIGIMDLYSGCLTYCNAGHDEPLFWSGVPGDSPKFLHTSENLPLGFDVSSKYVEGSMNIGPDALLMLYTDGVNEARNKHGEFYGNDRFLELVSGIISCSAAQINDALLEELRRFSSGTEQSDDITLLTLRNTAGIRTLSITNDVMELRKLPGFMNEIFAECPMPDREEVLVRTGIDEAITNCVRYAFDAPGGQIKLSAALKDQELVFELTDNGKEFDPTTYESPVRDTLEPGGLGIIMMKANFDTLEYKRFDGCNILKLKKKLIWN